MEIKKFYEMFNDKHFFNLKKMKYKYASDFDAFIDALRDFQYSRIPLNSFDGKNLVYIENKIKTNQDVMKLLIQNQGKIYGTKAVEDEIISTSKIESIDYSRDSVRKILKGYTPSDDAEARILGIKNGFDFIADKSNKITEENIFKLYNMTISKTLDDENNLKNGKLYRHDSVVIQNIDGTISHVGMDCKKLPSAMRMLVEYINSETSEDDLVKASIIHFYFSYIHPYFDGNGRMARLLHLWFLVQKGYDNTLFIPFSNYILKSVKKYYEAYTLIEENNQLSGVIDVTPLIVYFFENVYNAFEKCEIDKDVFEDYKKALKSGEVTGKEKKLWQFVISNYGQNEFSTKQLEKAFGDAAYATIRSFVLKFESLGLLESTHYSNRVKYRIKN